MFTSIPGHLSRLGLSLATLLQLTPSRANIPCEARLLSPAAVVAGTLTPSPWIMKGDDVALRMIANDRSALDGYREDPKFLALEESARLDIEHVKQQAPLGTHGRSIEYYTDKSKWLDAVPAQLIPTWAEMGVRAINRLIYHRMYVVGLIAAPVHADGQLFDQASFIEHDLAHAATIESFRLGKNLNAVSEVGALRSKAFDQELNYDEITRSLTPHDHLLFDLAYFDFFHETSAIARWSIMLATMGNWVTDETLTEKCRTLHQVDDRLIKRFLDSTDLRVNLPLEVRAFMKANPEQSEDVIRALIDAAFSVFIPFQVQASRMALQRYPNMLR